MNAVNAVNTVKPVTVVNAVNAGNDHSVDDGEPRAAADPGEVHVYDGIEEHDNRLPRWWLATLWGAIVFAFAYWGWFETLGVGLSPRAEFDNEMVARQARDASRAGAGGAEQAGAVDDTQMLALSHDAAVVERGKAVFQSTCLACHAALGQGLVGPNLTDNAWLHGGRPTDILAVVADGVIAKGMPAWQPALGAQKVRDVTAFLLTIKGQNLVGKEPQGVVEN